MLVLFIEDDPMNRRVVRDMLSVAGADMVEAADGETGLRLLDERDVGLVLVDLRMPGMDGLTVIRRIRARGDAKASLPVIVVTADGGPTIRADSIEAGADDLLLKPVAMEELFTVMGRLIAQRHGSEPLI